MYKQVPHANQQGIILPIFLVWLFFVVGWIANIVQIFMQMPATLGEATPFWIAKIVCIFVAPVGGILGWIGFFQ